MKKNYLAMAALAFGLLGFSACSSDDALDDSQSTVTTGEMQDVELTFNINVNSGKETRGGRPLWSSEALQQVQYMNLYIFKDDKGTYKYDKEITGGNNFGFNDAGNAVNSDEPHSYTLTTKLEAGAKYKILAVGYEEGYNATFKTLSLTTGTTTLAQAKIELAESVNAADEMFSGVTKEIDLSTGTTSFNVNVELKRVVAGVLGYFKNVPYQLENNGALVQVKHILVQVAKKGTSALLETRAASEASDGYTTIIDILLTGSKDGNNNWYANTTDPASGVQIEANSFLKGAYSLPIAAHVSNATLRVVLTGEQTSTILKEYPVVMDGSNNKFALDANSIYMIGHKSKADGTDGDDDNPGGDTPDDKDDDPVDLSKEQILNIKVIAGWDKKYDLGLN